VTNREATTARELPRSLVALGAGPTGSIRKGAGHDGAQVIELSDGSRVEGHELLLAVGRLTDHVVRRPAAHSGMPTV
jgi:hypothetical protein